jgi:tetratricopeptide (TPR) repeat protein
VLLTRALLTPPARGHLLAEAEAAVAAALELDWHGDGERRDRALLVLALARLERGDAAEAMRLAREVAVRRIDWPSARLLQGAALERMGKREGALALYRAVLRRQPGHPQAEAGVSRLTARP